MARVKAFMKIRIAMFNTLFLTIALCSTAQQGTAMVVPDDISNKEEQNLEEEPYTKQGLAKINDQAEQKEIIPAQPDTTAKSEEIEIEGEFFGESFFEKEPSEQMFKFNLE